MMSNRCSVAVLTLLLGFAIAGPPEAQWPGRYGGGDCCGWETYQSGTDAGAPPLTFPGFEGLVAAAGILF